MKSGRIFFVVVIVSTLGLTCSDPEMTSSPVSSIQASSGLSINQGDTAIVTKGRIKPDLAYCGDGRVAVGRTGPWGDFDHYLAQSGKRVGHNSTIGTPGSLRRTYGFNSAEITDQEFTNYDTAGYAAENLMVALSYAYRWDGLAQNPNAGEFYVDEPISAHNWGMQDIIDLADSVHARGKKFGIGEQAIFLFWEGSQLNYFNQYVVPHLDFITYTNYTSSDNADDQRPTWTTLKERYGSKFDRVWMSSTADNGEYASLIGHAGNLGINTIFFFGQNGTQQQLDNFCSAERQMGWLRKFVQEVLQMWCCTTTTYNPETCELNSVTPTGNVVEY